MDDRRMFERIIAKLRVKFLDPNNNSVKYEAETVDISANGIGFITKEGLALNTIVEMWLCIPDEREPLYLQGEVMWATPLTYAGHNRVGVYIENKDLLGLARVLWVNNKN